MDIEHTDWIPFYILIQNNVPDCPATATICHGTINVRRGHNHVSDDALVRELQTGDEFNREALANSNITAAQAYRNVVAR